jgi:hypothetical protein
MKEYVVSELVQHELGYIGDGPMLIHYVRSAFLPANMASVLAARCPSEIALERTLG